MEDKDFELARRLQARFDAEANGPGYSTPLPSRVESSSVGVETRQRGTHERDSVTKAVQGDHTTNKHALTNSLKSSGKHSIDSINGSLRALVTFSVGLRRVRCIKCKKTVLPEDLDPESLFYSREYHKSQSVH